MDTQFLLQVVAASLAAVGVEEFIKNFFKPANKAWYAAVMLPLSVGCFCAARLLPLWVIGSLLTVGSVQLCYQTLVQGFQKIIDHVFGKINKGVDRGIEGA